MNSLKLNHNGIAESRFYPAPGVRPGKRARKGVFITTSGFTKEAMEYAGMIESRIILIDGERLARLMIEHNVGAQTASVYEVKRIDGDYFEQ